MEFVSGLAVVLILCIFFICIGYVKAPPDTAFIISGFRKPRILIGKAGIRIPFLERLDKLSLKMFSVDVKTTDFVPNAEYINVKVDATVKIRIGQSEEMMTLASKFFLNEKDYVVNNEYVELAQGKYEKSFVNALLRKLTEFKEPDDEHIRACLPEWLYRLLKAQYDGETLGMIIDMYQSIPSVYYRLNKSKASFDDLKQYDIDVMNDDIFTCGRNLLDTEGYRNGLFYVQDLNSSSLYRHLDLRNDHTLLDVCSAPGSKLFNCLDIIKPENAYANDVHENRVNLIRKMAEKLGYEGINYLCSDDRKLNDTLNMRFDRIMLDAPCSGLGVIGRKPDLKFHVRPESLDELQKLQSELIRCMDPLLKTDGIMLYSTCTLNRKENNVLIKRFLDEYPYELLEEDTIINGYGDAFYYAKLKKVK